MPINQVSRTGSPVKNVLTIAGSDPSGGAGLQGDLKTFSALGVYGTNVITAVIAQNTCGVLSVYPVSPQAISEQLEHLLDDVDVEAVKIGMVASRDVAEVIAEALSRRRPRWVVLDPVMVAKSGDVLVADTGIEAVRDILVPLADVITPNLPEAAVLLGCDTPTSTNEMEAMMPALTRLGAPYVMLKGGHLQGAECPDLLATPKGYTWLPAPRINTQNLHGTGCTLSSAVAACLARQAEGVPVEDTIYTAKQWLHAALEASVHLEVGKGRGPVHHFHEWW